MRGGRIELAGVGFLEIAHVAGVLDAGGLHSETDSEVGDVVLAGVADAVEHSGDAALAEASRDQDAVIPGELLLVASVVLVFDLKAFSFNPLHIELKVVL